MSHWLHGGVLAMMLAS